MSVDGVDLDVNEGEILSVIGPNGAGKTTLFNVVTGLYTADEGSISFDGHNLIGLQPNQICAFGIARTFQTVRLFPNMTVLENTMVGQHCRTRSGVFGAVLRLPRTRAEERQVLEQRFGLVDGYSRTLEEVGRQFRVTRERIRQIEAKALRKMRHPTRIRQLEGFLEAADLQTIAKPLPSA